MSEDRQTRLRRLHMRSIRRGIKEMDLILTAFSEARLAGLSEAELDLYDRLLGENDPDLYQWVSGQAEPPAPFRPLIEEIRAGAQGVGRQG